MTFLALLTKELRLRMRRERSIWIIVIYLLLMALLSWFTLNNTRSSSYGNATLSDTGLYLYYLLTVVQLLLVLFITPAFTATSVNGEKERQTFDLLLCSRLSSFSLVTGKLLAGLANSVLLIAASTPLFSLVFFFGGISPFQFLQALVLFVVSSALVGSFGLFCSSLFSRPSVSTAITYMTILLWLVSPVLISYLSFLHPTVTYSSAVVIRSGTNTVAGTSPSVLPSPAPPLYYAWSPILALTNTFPNSSSLNNYSFAHLTLSPWLVYLLLSIFASLLFFLLSIWIVKPNPIGRLRTRMTKRKYAPLNDQATAA